MHQIDFKSPCDMENGTSATLNEVIDNEKWSENYAFAIISILSLVSFNNKRENGTSAIRCILCKGES